MPVHAGHGDHPLGPLSEAFGLGTADMGSVLLGCNFDVRFRTPQTRSGPCPCKAGNEIRLRCPVGAGGDGRQAIEAPGRFVRHGAFVFRGVRCGGHRREDGGCHKPGGHDADQGGSNSAADYRSWELALLHRAGHGEFPFGSTAQDLVQIGSLPNT
jgi:hypothetical protein